LVSLQLLIYPFKLINKYNIDQEYFYKNNLNIKIISEGIDSKGIDNYYFKTLDDLNYIKEEFKEKRTLAKNAGFAINPFYLILTFYYKFLYKVICLSRKLNNFVALYGNIEE